jgi:GntR family transcriptional regulator
VDQRVRGAQDFTRDGRIVEFARGVHAASRFSWSYTFKIPE